MSFRMREVKDVLLRENVAFIIASLLSFVDLECRSSDSVLVAKLIQSIVQNWLEQNLFFNQYK